MSRPARSWCRWMLLLGLLAAAAWAPLGGAAVRAAPAAPGEDLAPRPATRPAAAPASGGGASLTEHPSSWPSAEQWRRVLSFRDHNTRVVVLGAGLLGLACGAVGGFLLLRRRALLGDAISHATLPGIGIFFMVAVYLGADEKSFPLLLAGALVAGVTGGGCVLLMRDYTKLKEDAALAIVLSVFFGAGVAILGMIQAMPSARAAGLETFIYGQTASMLAGDARLIAVTAGGVALLCALFYKELAVLAFDQDFAASLGLPVRWLDAGLMVMAVGVTVIGLQAVGVILIVAMLIIPAAAARFWTDRLWVMLLLGAGLGGASGAIGALLSALVPRLPAGAVIVMVASAVFVVSMLFGPARGVLVRGIQGYRLRVKVARQNLLRAFYEANERGGGGEATDVALELAALRAARAWSAAGLRWTLARARREGLVRPAPEGRWRLTARGAAEAARVVRNHRLWEAYLLAHAELAPSQVDRDADLVEHVIGHEMVAALSSQLAAGGTSVPVPPSAHPLAPGSPEASEVPRD